MATLYLQSASGGLYADDDIALDITLARNTAVHLTPQAATVVHRCASGCARLTTDIAIGPGAWLETIGEPYILLPGARLETRTRVTLASDAHGILVESALAHTPSGMARSSFSWDWQVRLATAEDNTLVLDRGSLDELSITPPGSLSTLETHGSLIALGPTFDDTRLTRLRQQLHPADVTSVYWGMSRLANAPGLALRVLGRDAAVVNDFLNLAWRLLRDPDHPPRPRPK
jgi:urease accessory protein